MRKRKKPEERKSIKGRKAYNNGKEVIYLTPEDEVPKGFVKGGLSKRTPKQIREIALKSSITQKKTWDGMSKQQKKDWSEKCREAQLSISKIKRAEIIDKTKITNSLKSEEEIKEINLKRSIANKSYWSNLSKESKQEFFSRVRNTCLLKYHVPYHCMTEECRKASSNNSKPNEIFSNLLKGSNILFEREFSLDKYSYDFKIGEILVEINPSVTHNSTWSPFKHRPPQTKNYHYLKTKISNDKGYRCIHVWDWDNLDKIVNIFLPKEKVYARDCIIKEIDNKVLDSFLESYHFQGTCKNQSIKLGLYYRDKLIQVITFGKPRYNKNYEYELLRLCTLPCYIVTGGSEKLFNYFIQKYKPFGIISYCDNSKFTGEVYKKLGFILKDKGQPSKHWYNIKTKKHITDNLLRQRGFDQLFNTSYGKGTSNEVLMKNSGFIEIYDCGQSTYIYNKSEREENRNGN